MTLPTMRAAQLSDGLYVHEEDCRANVQAALKVRADLVDELVAALRKALEHCPCTIKERDSGHLVDCCAPEADALIAKAEGR